MDIYEALWDYQAADINLSRFERKLQQSEVRKKLLAVRNQLIEQQSRVKNLEASLVEGQKRANAINLEIKKLMNALENYEIAEADPEDEEGLKKIRQQTRELEGYNKSLAALNAELAKINKMAYAADGIVKDAVTKLQKGKGEFDALKQQHDKELAGAKGELEKLQSIVAEKEKGLDAELLAKYKQIKKTRLNPVAKVEGDQCGGCNMTIPSLTMRRLKDNAGIIECENCGRILYYIKAE